MSTVKEDLLIEIGTEELPPKALRSLMERCGKVESWVLARLILRRIGLSWENRRLARFPAAGMAVLRP